MIIIVFSTPLTNNRVFFIRKAATQAEFCNVTQILDDRAYAGFERNETYQKAWYDVCIKSEHPSSFICPKNNDFLKPPDEYALKNTKNIR